MLEVSARPILERCSYLGCTQSVRELGEHRHRNRWLCANHLREALSGDREADNGALGHDRGRARLAVEEGHLAEETADAESDRPRSAPPNGSCASQ